MVQSEIARRATEEYHSFARLFSYKIKCGQCGGWYGPKVWHSNDKYRRLVWQCNNKYSKHTQCSTPHLTEQQIQATFVSAVNTINASN